MHTIHMLRERMHNAFSDSQDHLRQASHRKQEPEPSDKMPHSDVAFDVYGQVDPSGAGAWLWFGSVYLCLAVFISLSRHHMLRRIHVSFVCGFMYACWCVSWSYPVFMWEHAASCDSRLITAVHVCAKPHFHQTLSVLKSVPNPHLYLPKPCICLTFPPQTVL